MKELQQNQAVSCLIIVVTILCFVAYPRVITKKNATLHAPVPTVTMSPSPSPSPSPIVFPTFIPEPGYKLVSRALPPGILGIEKLYMPYDSITRLGSAQLELQEYAYTDDKGFRRVGRRYMIALGTYYADYIGQLFIITFSDGTIIECIIGDVKADIHTDKTHRYSGSDNIVEFIIDLDVLNKRIALDGDIAPLLTESAVICIQEVIYEQK